MLNVFEYIFLFLLRYFLNTYICKVSDVYIKFLDSIIFLDNSLSLQVLFSILISFFLLLLWPSPFLAFFIYLKETLCFSSRLCKKIGSVIQTTLEIVFLIS